MGNVEDATRIIKDQKLQELQVMISLRDLLGESFVPESPPLGLPLHPPSLPSPPLDGDGSNSAGGEREEGEREEGAEAGRANEAGAPGSVHTHNEAHTAPP